MSNPFIRLEEVSKSFGLLTVVEGLNLEIGKGEFISLLGPIRFWQDNDTYDACRFRESDKRRNLGRRQTN